MQTISKMEKNNSSLVGTLSARKRILRRLAYKARIAQQNKDEISQQVCLKVINQADYRNAETVMWYLDCRSELRTRQMIPDAIASKKKIVIPFCVLNELHIWHLFSLDELVIGSFGIFEPPRHRWYENARKIDVRQLDLVIVPGVAFDQHGNRLGNGQGYYDRLLAQVRADTRLIAPCYQSQLMDDIPAETHDIRMHKIITEKQIYIIK